MSTAVKLTSAQRALVHRIEEARKWYQRFDPDARDTHYGTLLRVCHTAKAYRSRALVAGVHQEVLVVCEQVCLVRKVPVRAR